MSDSQSAQICAHCVAAPHADGRVYSLFVCSQGPSFDSKLVALVVHICSLLVVNTKTNITETALTNLSSFSRLARAADAGWVTVGAT